MRKGNVVRWSFLLGLLAVATAVGGQQAAPSTQAKHPFSAKDWAQLRSARAVAVAADGTILYTSSLIEMSKSTREIIRCCSN